MSLVASMLVAPSASAEVQFTVSNGLVTLRATGATVQEILGEWTRVGGTTFVNADRIPGGPITLELVDVPERVALDLLLRSASGYIIAPTTDQAPRASLVARVLVLPTSAAPPPLRVAPAPALSAAALDAVQAGNEARSPASSTGGVTVIGGPQPAAPATARPLNPAVPIGGPLSQPGLIPDRFLTLPENAPASGAVTAPIQTGNPGAIVAPQPRQLRPGETFSPVLRPPQTPPQPPPQPEN